VSTPRRLLLAACALLLLLGSTLPAAAQPTERPATEGGRLSLDVLRLDGVVSAQDPLRLRLRVRNGGLLDREDVRVLATVHREAIGRWELQQATREGVVGNIIHPIVADLGVVPARGSRTVELTQTLDDLGLARPGQDGVYPLRLQVLKDGEVTDELVTSLVVVPPTVEHPLALSLVLPLVLPPARDAEGVVADAAVLEAIDDAGGLARTVAALAEAPRLDVTLGLDGHTLRDLQDLADGFAVRREGTVLVRPADSTASARAREILTDLEALAARRRTTVLALPYAGADLVALVRHGLAPEARRQLEDGRDAVAQAIGVSDDSGVLWPPDALDDATLALAREAGIDTVVADSRSLLTRPGGDLSPSPVRTLRRAGDRTTVLVPDPYLVPVLTDGSTRGPAVAAQQVLAEVAAVYFELPGTTRRGVLLAPPPGGSVPGSLVSALAPALAGAPFLRTVPVDDLAERVAPEPEPVQLRYPAEARARELPLTHALLLADARRSLGSLDGVLAEPNGMTARLDRLLLQAASVAYRDDPAAGRALMRAVSNAVAEVYGAVEVLDAPPVTLTAVEGQLPVTVRSTADIPLRVKIALRSPRYEVEGGPTREVVLAPSSTEILTFRVRARSPGGTSPIQVVVSDLDGVLDLAVGTVVVRSTAFSVAAVVVMAGAALFLLLWWLRGRAARRRSTPAPPARPASAPEPASTKGRP
jgi:hypothetical protein